MADNLTVEQQQALAIAEAERAKAESKNSASWSDVLKEAPVKAISGVTDEILNAPHNLYNLGKTAVELGNAAFGPGNVNVYGGQLPSDNGEITVPEDTAKNYLTEQGMIDPSLRNRMTPEQRMADTAIQAGVGGLAGGTAKQALVGGLSALAGQGVTEVTGSEGAGLLTSLLSPLAGSKIASLNAAKEAAQKKYALKKQIFEDAIDLGFTTVPDTRAIDFASRPKLLEIMARNNQERTNEVSRRYVGLPEDTPITRKELNNIRGKAYKEGYEPIKNIGTVLHDNEFIQDLDAIEKKFTGQGNSFPDLVPDKIRELTTGYLQNKYAAEDIIDKLRTIRKQATKFINSDIPDNEEYGFAMKDLADAFEGLLERAAKKKGMPPELMDNYKTARKLIARTHTVEGALDAGGDISGKKLAKAYDNYIPIDGDLEKVAKFYSINNPRKEGIADKLKPEFLHLAGATGGYAAATAMGLPFWAGPILATAGFGAGKGFHEALAGPLRKAIMSKEGQKSLLEDFSSLGIDPRSGPLSGMMFENAQGAQ